MKRRLRTLLSHPDPAVQQQGIELVLSMGDAGVEAVLSDVRLTADGLPWRPDGLSDALLRILVLSDHPLRLQIRRLCLAGLSDLGLLSSLHRLPALEELDLSHCTLLADHCADLSGLPVRRLVLRGCSVADLSFLATLPALTDLDLTEAGVYSTTPLEGLYDLRRLCLRRTRFASVRPGRKRLTLPTGLTTLDIRSSVALVENLAALPLTALSLSSLHLDDLDDTACLSGVEEMAATARSVADVAGLPVTELRLANSGESLSLEGLSQLPRLHHLTIAAHGHARMLRGWEDVHAAPALTVLDISPVELWALDLHPRWICGQASIQSQLSWVDFSRHPLRDPPTLARMRRWWHVRSHTRRLVATVEIGHKIRVIKAYRKQCGAGLRDSRTVVDGVRRNGLVCLSLPQAVVQQRLLAGCGITTRIEGWG